MSSVSSRSGTIVGEEALVEFRQGLTGDLALRLLREADGRLLIQLPVGVGKSHWLVQTVEQAITSGTYDLVIVLVPRWDVLEELRLRLSAVCEPTVLRPRPRRQCGELDPQWTQLEQAGCGLLGREMLCRRCPRLGRCTWPDRTARRLRNCRLLLTTQQHVVLDPRFVGRIRQQLSVERVLTLVDESDLLLKPVESRVTSESMDLFITAQEAVPAQTSNGEGRQWLERSRLIRDAGTVDLQGHWPSLFVDPEWALDVQRTGWEQFGPRFRFLAYDLQQFCRSDRTSRERLPDGGLRFAALPDFGHQFIIYSGSIAPDLVRYRLDPEFQWGPVHSPFRHMRFEHPGTRWYNLAMQEGMACFSRRTPPGSSTSLRRRLPEISGPVEGHCWWPGSGFGSCASGAWRNACGNSGWSEFESSQKTGGATTSPTQARSRSSIMESAA